MNITLFDRASYEITKREYTPEGFLRVPGRVARTGIQDYLASELSLKGDQNRIVKVYRPADEVFKSESLDSYNTVDVTNDHPPKLIDSKTFKAVTVGSVVSGGLQDGDFVTADLLIKDEETIKLIESGKAQLSAGYTAEYVDEKGVTEDGQDYEFIQRDIRINHVAVVNSARAGAMARIFDKSNEVKLMKVTLDNGRAVEVEDSVAAQVEDSINRLTEAATTANDACAKLQDKADGLEAKKDALEEENEELKKKSSDEAIAAHVADVALAMDGARKLAGADFECDSINANDIKRAALTVHKESKDYSKESDAYISAAFDMEMEKKTDDEEEEEEKKKAASDSHTGLSVDMAEQRKVADDNKKSFNDSLTQGWKKTLEDK